MSHTTTVKLTDEHSGTTATVETFEVADTLRPWYTGAPADVTEAIDKLESAIRSDDVDAIINLSAFLAVDVEIHRTKD